MRGNERRSGLFQKHSLEGILLGRTKEWCGFEVRIVGSDENACLGSSTDRKERTLVPWGFPVILRSLAKEAVKLFWNLRFWSNRSSKENEPLVGSIVPFDHRCCMYGFESAIFAGSLLDSQRELSAGSRFDS